MCLYPRYIQNKRFLPNKKNGGIIPPITDTRALHVPIPCENCMECRKKKQRDWMIRIQEDIKQNPRAKFVTLTFSNEAIQKLHQELSYKKIKTVRKTIIMKNGKIRRYYRYTLIPTTPPTGYELDNAIATLAMRQFNERYRKQYGKALRHWTVTELGHNGTENIHLHGIIWPNCTLDQIEKLWQFGWIWKYKQVGQQKINYVNAQTANYITKYVAKKDELHKHYNSIVLSSPGIGNNYTKTITAQRNAFNDTKTRDYYKTTTGHKVTLPKYWRHKLYTENQRQILWMNHLNKNIQYVCGIKVSVKKNNTELFATRDEYRKKNRRLGYGSYHKDIERLEWEQQRRQEKTNTRLNIMPPAAGETSVSP